MTTFNKAVTGALASAIPAFAAFSTSCSGVFSVFGSNGGTAEVLAAGIVGIIAGVVVYITPNKPTIAVTK